MSALLPESAYLALLRQDSNAWCQDDGYTVPRILAHCPELIIQVELDECHWENENVE